MTIDENNQLSIFCLMVSPQEAMGHMAKYIQEKKPMEAAFGLDRFSKENQGVDKKYDSVFTIYYMNEKKEWAIGIFPYNEAGEFGEVDWDNTFWKGILSESIETFSQLSKEVYDE